MAAPKVMSGARAKVGVYDAQTGETKFIGMFSNLSYGVTYDVQPAFILGAFGAAEIDYTAVDVVNISASGWRIIGHGWHVDGRLPRVQDLLLHEYLELVVVDRASEAQGLDPRIARIRNVRPTSGQGGFSSRSLSEVTLTYMGLLVDDESVENAEHPTAATLP
jgi:hypothetical protein